mmetsp:Transcript_14904/g.23738  ORF Transcript_14904/g.23738 Transcript_14904/m.23738 type:complete len:1069 (+) Transcript_14904:34-3240(+)
MGAVIAILMNILKSVIGFALGGGGEKRKHEPLSAKEVREMRLRKLGRGSKAPRLTDQRDDTKENGASADALRRRKKAKGNDSGKEGKTDVKIERPTSSFENTTTPNKNNANPSIKPVQGPSQSKKGVSSDKSKPELDKSTMPDPEKPSSSLQHVKEISSVKPMSVEEHETANTVAAKKMRKKEQKKSPPAKTKKKTLPAAKPLEKQKALNLAEIEDEMFRPILRIALNPEVAKTCGFTHIQLEDEVEDANSSQPAGEGGEEKGTSQQQLLTLGNIDFVLIRRFDVPNTSESSHFGYMVSCYRRTLSRLDRARKGLTSSSSSSSMKTSYSQAKLEAQVKSLEGLCQVLISYAHLSLSPSAGICDAGQIKASLATCRTLLGAEPKMSRTLPPGMFNLLLDRYIVVAEGEGSCKSSSSDNINPSSSSSSSSYDDSGSEEFTHPLLDGILSLDSKGERSKWTSDGYSRPMRCLALLSSHRLGAKGITSHPSFAVPKELEQHRDFRNYERKMLLSPAFTFTQWDRLTQSQDRVTIETAQANFDAVQAGLCTIFGRLCSKSSNVGFSKTGASPRNKLYRWITSILRLNKERRKMSYNPTKAASAHFLITLGGVLARMCRPFIKRRQHNVVDGRYLLSKREDSSSESKFKWRVEYDDVTRLAASMNDKDVSSFASIRAAAKDIRAREQQGDDVKSSKAEIRPKAISTRIVSSVAVTETLFLTMEALHLGWNRQAEGLAQLVRHLHQIRQEIAQNPSMESLLGQRHRMLNLQYNHSRVVLYAQDELQAIAEVYSFVSEWMLQLLENQEDSSLNRRVLEHVPEYFLDDIITFWTMLRSEVLASSYPSADLGMEPIKLAFSLMRRGSLVKNPHLKGKLPGFILCMIEEGPPSRLTSRHSYQNSLLSWGSNRESTIIGSLIDLYVDIEIGENQYYAKFKPRYDICRVLKIIWGESEKAKNAFRQLPSERTVKFVNMLLNDIIWLLDEALKCLEEIHVYQERVKAREEGKTLGRAAARTGGGEGDDVKSRSTSEEEKGQSSPLHQRRRPQQQEQQNPAEEKKQYEQAERNCYSYMRLANR